MDLEVVDEQRARRSRPPTARRTSRASVGVGVEVLDRADGEPRDVPQVADQVEESVPSTGRHRGERVRVAGGDVVGAVAAHGVAHQVDAVVVDAVVAVDVAQDLLHVEVARPRGRSGRRGRTGWPRDTRAVGLGDEPDRQVEGLVGRAAVAVQVDDQRPVLLRRRVALGHVHAVPLEPARVVPSLVEAAVSPRRREALRRRGPDQAPGPFSIPSARRAGWRTCARGRR